jgi:2-haloacid dehalogenase
VTHRYSTVLFDLDHTLLDSDASEALAFAATLRLAGVDDPLPHFPVYDSINRGLWAAVERHEVTPGHVRVARFEQFIAAIGLEADPLVLADAFAGGLGAYGELYPGTRDVLDAMAGRVRMGLVTNGLSEVQRRRIERLQLERYFDAVVISAEVGVSKPSAAIFDIAFEQLGQPSRSQVLMVGDSLSSDIRGGRNAGVATCWYNPHGKSAGTAAGAASRLVDHEIVHITDLLDLLGVGGAVGGTA